jgi:hypothetical protein
MQENSVKTTEISRTSREFTESTPFGPNQVKETVVIRKQTWSADAGIYSGKSYELGQIFWNGHLVRDWSTPWKEVSI